MASNKQTAPQPDHAEPTPLDVALLAARLLPPLELPDNWATEHHLNLKKILAEATTGKGRKFDPRYDYPAGWPTQFEVVAEEATRRARILLDAAAGRIRQERLDYDRSGVEADRQMKEFAEATAAKEREFERRAPGKPSLPIMEALKIALPKVYKHNPENAYQYWREYLRNADEDYRKEHEHPAVPVKFRDELTEKEASYAVDRDSPHGHPHVVVIDCDRSYKVTRHEYGVLAIYLQQFCESAAGARVRSLWSSKGGRKGGKKSQANIRQEGKLSAAEGRKLDVAAKKVRKVSKSA